RPPPPTPFPYTTLFRSDRIQPAGAIYFMMDEKDVQSAMAHPGAMIGSDGIPFDAHPHPRLWGTFPRVLGHYSRELKLFPLEDARSEEHTSELQSRSDLV